MVYKNTAKINGRPAKCCFQSVIFLGGL